MLIQLRDLNNVAYKELYNIWRKSFKTKTAFTSYLDKRAFIELLESKNYSPELSLGIFYCDHLIACSLTALEVADGQKTAYNIFTGTISEYNHQGLEVALFETLMPCLEEQKVSLYRNDIHSDNSNDIQACEKIGYKVKRELGNFRLSRSHFMRKKSKKEVVIHPGDFDSIEAMGEYYKESKLCRQSLQTLKRKKRELTILIAYGKNQPVGWIISNTKQQKVLSLFVLPEFRKNYIANMLINSLFNLIPAWREYLNFFYVDNNNDEMVNFMRSCGGETVSSKLEMEYAFE